MCFFCFFLVIKSPNGVEFKGVDSWLESRFLKNLAKESAGVDSGVGTVPALDRSARLAVATSWVDDEEATSPGGVVSVVRANSGFVSGLRPVDNMGNRNGGFGVRQSTEELEAPEENGLAGFRPGVGGNTDADIGIDIESRGDAQRGLPEEFHVPQTLRLQPKEDTQLSLVSGN